MSPLKVARTISWFCFSRGGHSLFGHDFQNVYHQRLIITDTLNQSAQVADACLNVFTCWGVGESLLKAQQAKKDIPNGFLFSLSPLVMIPFDMLKYVGQNTERLKVHVAKNSPHILFFLQNLWCQIVWQLKILQKFSVQVVDPRPFFLCFPWEEG